MLSYDNPLRFRKINLSVRLQKEDIQKILVKKIKTETNFYEFKVYTSFPKLQQRFLQKFLSI